MKDTKIYIGDSSKAPHDVINPLHEMPIDIKFKKEASVKNESFRESKNKTIENENDEGKIKKAFLNGTNNIIFINHSFN